MTSRPTPAGPTSRLAPSFMVVVAALVTLALGASSEATDASSSGQPAQPFDTASSAEQAIAVEAALADARVQDVLGGRFVTLGVSLRTDKIPEIAAGDYPRLLDVWFYDYTSNAALWAVVDARAMAVTQVIHAAPGFQPTLAVSEITHAAALAVASPAAVERFGAAPQPAAAMLVNGPETTCPVDRCAVVGFLDGGRLASDFFVVVNLSTDSVQATVTDLAGVYAS